MKKIALSLAVLLFSAAGAHAAEMLDAATVKKLITDKTVIASTPRGDLKTFFSADGKAIRATEEGTWHVKDDGTHCIDGIRGGCEKVSPNGDGTYDRGKAIWKSFVDGKSL